MIGATRNDQRSGVERRMESKPVSRIQNWTDAPGSPRPGFRSGPVSRRLQSQRTAQLGGHADAVGRTDHLLHASPAVVGCVAQDAGVGRLIVSHIGLFDLDAAIAELKKLYTGPLTVGADLQCTQVL